MITMISANLGVMLIIIANVIWYRSKFMLKKKGYKVGMFTKHFDDYPNLLDAISSESDSSELKLLLIQKRLMQSILVLFPMGAVLIFTAA